MAVTNGSEAPSTTPKLLHLVRLPRTHNNAARRIANDKRALTQPVLLLLLINTKHTQKEQNTTFNIKEKQVKQFQKLMYHLMISTSSLIHVHRSWWLAEWQKRIWHVSNHHQAIRLLPLGGLSISQLMQKEISFCTKHTIHRKAQSGKASTASHTSSCVLFDLSTTKTSLR